MRVVTVAYAEFGTLTVAGVTAPLAISPSSAELAMTVTGEDVVIRTGVNMGPVIVETELFSAAPTVEAPGSREESIEIVGARAARVPVAVHGPTELPSNEAVISLPEDVEQITFRVYAIGRDVARDLAVSEPTERYLVQVWAS